MKIMHKITFSWFMCTFHRLKFKLVVFLEHVFLENLKRHYVQKYLLSWYVLYSYFLCAMWCYLFSNLIQIQSENISPKEHQQLYYLTPYLIRRQLVKIISMKYVDLHTLQLARQWSIRMVRLLLSIDIAWFCLC